MPAAGKPSTAWGRRLHEVLSDREWHEREEVILAVAAAVPPGVAWRHSEARRTCQLVGAPAPRVRGDNSTAIDGGARDVAQRLLASYVQGGAVERSGDLVRWTR